MEKLAVESRDLVLVYLTRAANATGTCLPVHSCLIWTLSRGCCPARSSAIILCVRERAASLHRVTYGTSSPRPLTCW